MGTHVNVGDSNNHHFGKQLQGNCSGDVLAPDMLIWSAELLADFKKRGVADHFLCFDMNSSTSGNPP
jgi:hypothetical protein